MSNDNGLGNLIISLRQLALINNPHLEDELNMKCAEAKRLVEEGVINGPHMAYFLTNEDRIRFYREHGGQLNLLNPGGAKECK